jgi:hypothetical protein
MCIVRGALRRLTEIVKGFNLVLEVSQKKISVRRSTEIVKGFNLVSSS